MEEIDLKDMFKYFINRIYFILIIIVLIVASGSIYTLMFKEPLYKSTTTVILVTDNNKNFTTSDIDINKNLVSTYAEIIKSRSVLNSAIENYDLPYTYDQLKGMVSVAAVDGTEIISIAVRDKSSIEAQELSDYIAYTFIDKVKELYSLSNVNILDHAEASFVADNINPTKEIAIYFVSGLVLSFVILFIRYYFDRRIKSVNEIESKVKRPIMGTVRDSKVFIKKNNSELIMIKDPTSAFSEDIRTIRANLDFASVDKETKTVLITSSIKGEGKSTISSNLAVSYAQNNKKVLIIDCDLRRGKLHHIFSLEGKNKGLSNLIAKKDLKNLDSYIRKTNIKNLSIITRGIVPPNPSELLNSKAFETTLKSLQTKFDLIILDGAPIANLADSLIISKLVDKTLIISSLGYTPIDSLVNTEKALDNISSDIAGIIVNRASVDKSNKYKYE